MSDRVRPGEEQGVRRPVLVLASGSPRRRALFGLLGCDFVVRVPEIDETPILDEDPHEYVERVARLKAGADVTAGEIVVGADTVVVVDGDILPKPLTPARTRAMLRRLAGRVHLVLTGLALARWDPTGPLIESVVETSRVRFVRLTEQEIDWYVATGEPLDKAGAYAIQERGGVFVESVEGSPSNVAGLPLAACVRMLRRAGFDPFEHLSP